MAARTPVTLEGVQDEIRLLKQKISLQEGLPFLYGFKHYKWSRDFYESTNRTCLLCAANQIGKSTVQIRKCINWATDTALWKRLWRKTPKQFWYFYPTSAQSTIEFETKWIDYLPAGEYKEHPVYGWKAEYKNKEIYCIRFNSGITIYFKTYSQKATALQTATVDAMFCDEEMPEELYDELMFRLSASRGYFSMVFTATIGQNLWRLALEPGQQEKEKLPGAFKLQVSMYDCLEFEDGTKSHWTREEIARTEARCKNEAEVLRRVWGRFIVDTGRKFPTFVTKRHLKKWHPIPKNWSVYVGVDSGSGGKSNHPAAITFVGVNEDHTKGRVFLGWRGDSIETTAGDILNQLRSMKRKYKISPVAQFYDWADKDFQIQAMRIGEPITPADKRKDFGEGIIGTLFKNDMMAIYETDETHKLATELLTLKVDTPKTKALDDFTDSFRYAISSIPWNFELGIKGDAIRDEVVPVKELTPAQKEVRDRRNHAFGIVDNGFDDESGTLEAEFAEWNEAYTF